MDNIFGKEGFFNKSQFKFIRYLVILVLAGVFLMLLGDFGKDVSTSKSKQSLASRKASSINTSASNLEESIELKLQKMLSQIEGVGKVDVDITLDSGSEYTYARDYQDSKQESLEEDNSGGNRKTIQYDNRTEVVLLNNSGEQLPLIKKEVKPQIRGVLVVAEGAENSYIKAKLLRAIKIGLGVPSYKIVILSKER
ncbi:stage III sporulation protein AG [Orenia metallireducens]|uniref:Stage III sporulation protein AG n=1 Tax=Orenia metallireducens TaxID=1413210 RepID=A0A285HL97_9FIRM|nr:stage III sporulation protein AG [Orenia metallireducens]SNY36519.1 stage III sporulation protein AG [Orenia metallireducens]